MYRRFLTVAAVITLLAGCTAGFAANPDSSSDLLRVREAVWRSWFANDAKTLRQLVPPETIVISAGEKQWKHQAAVLQSAAQFRADGGKLIRLEFPRTEIQHFGDVAILYSEYTVETEMRGKRSVSSGRATEIFVLHDGHWTNPGWHTDAEK
jgi:ketosteroid isomerase-like protein